MVGDWAHKRFASDKANVCKDLDRTDTQSFDILLQEFQYHRLVRHRRFAQVVDEPVMRKTSRRDFKVSHSASALIVVPVVAQEEGVVVEETGDGGHRGQLVVRSVI